MWRKQDDLRHSIPITVTECHCVQVFGRNLACRHWVYDTALLSLTATAEQNDPSVDVLIILNIFCSQCYRSVREPANLYLFQGPSYPVSLIILPFRYWIYRGCACWLIGDVFVDELNLCSLFPFSLPSPRGEAGRHAETHRWCSGVGM